LPGEPGVEFLSLDEVVTIHERLIARFGGPRGIGDPGLLESALYRPRSGYYRDIAEMAAALFESLLMNHPFVDGNKRVAFFATDVFLRLNGWHLKVEPAVRKLLFAPARAACRSECLSSFMAVVFPSRDSMWRFWAGRAGAGNGSRLRGGRRETDRSQGAAPRVGRCGFRHPRPGPIDRRSD